MAELASPRHTVNLAVLVEMCPYSDIIQILLNV